MTEKTPTKVSTLNGNYISVNLLQSPAVVTSPSSRNLTGFPRVARDVVANVYNNIQKWNNCQVEGASIVQEIILLKCSSTNTYSDELEKLTERLKLIVQTISLYSNNLDSSSAQISALTKLDKQEAPLFISLTIQEISYLIEAISKAYKSEFKVKQSVLENIAHSKSENEAMFYAACWIHQQYITNKIKTQLEALLIETGHRQIT